MNSNNRITTRYHWVLGHVRDWNFSRTHEQYTVWGVVNTKRNSKPMNNELPFNKKEWMSECDFNLYSPLSHNTMSWKRKLCYTASTKRKRLMMRPSICISKTMSLSGKDSRSCSLPKPLRWYLKVARARRLKVVAVESDDWFDVKQRYRHNL